MLGVGSGFAQESGPWIAGGFGQRGTDFDVSGTLLHSVLLGPTGNRLPSEAPFLVSKSDRGAVFELAAGYDQTLGGGFFLGVESSFNLSDVATTLGPAVSDLTSTEFLTVTECPPPGPVPFSCLVFREVPHATREVQSLAIDVEEGLGGALRAKAGYAWKESRIWVSVGLALQGIEVSYDLPQLERTRTSIRFPPSTVVALPAETRQEKDTLHGRSLGIGFEHDIGSHLSVVLAYSQTDFDDVDFFDTVRVADLSAGGTSESGNISLKWSF